MVSESDPARWRRLARPGHGAQRPRPASPCWSPGSAAAPAGRPGGSGPSSLQIQPSEMAKLALVLFAADVLDRRADARELEVPDGRRSSAPSSAVATLVMQAARHGHDHGAGHASPWPCSSPPASPPGRSAGIFGAGVAGFGSVLAVAAPYRWRRLTSFLHPLADTGNTGYQSAQGLAALGHGRPVGAGLGASIATWGYLPNAQTDFIFAVIGEEARPGRHGGASPACSPPWPWSASASPAAARTATRLRGRRGHRLARRPGGDQHRRGRRPPAGHRRAAAVRVLRRARRWSSPCSAWAGRPRGPPVVSRRPGDRRRRDRRWWHRRPRASRRSPSARPWSPAATRARRSTSSGRPRGMERRLVPAAGFEVTLLPGRGVARRLTLDNLGAVAGLLAAAVGAVVLVGRRRPARGGLRRRLRQRGLRRGCRRLAGADRRRRAERRARAGQPPGRPVRRQRPRCRSRTRRCPAPWSPATRCATRCAPSTAPTPGAGRPATALGLPVRGRRRGGRRRFARRPAASTRRRCRTGPGLGRPAPASPSATSSASGTGWPWPPPRRRRHRVALRLPQVRFEDRMDLRLRRRRPRRAAGGSGDLPSWPPPGWPGPGPPPRGTRRPPGLQRPASRGGGGGRRHRRRETWTAPDWPPWSTRCWPTPTASRAMGEAAHGLARPDAAAGVAALAEKHARA